METSDAAAGAASERRSGVAVIIAILAVAALLRGVILFTGQRWLRSDEAVTGLMAKHVFSRGESFLFLYGQPYGGGHAIEAYIAAPFFKLFGPSAILLTAIPALISLVNILLLWLICHRLFGARVADGTAALYAFAPPVAYQAFLVNGGTESFCLALVAMLFFVRAFYDMRSPTRNATLAGLFGGLAYYAMDYGILYPIVFAALLIVSRREDKGKLLAAMTGGFLIGCLPLILFNLVTDFANLRQMAGGGAGSVSLVQHVWDALSGIFRGELAAFVGGDVDDIVPASWPLHAAAWLVIAAVAVLIYRNRSWLGATLRKPSSRPTPGPEMLPLFFIIIYLAIYLVAKFSLPGARTPRYFMPFAPFFAMAVALLLLSRSGKGWAAAGTVAVVALACLGAVRSLDWGLRDWHEEHRIRCSGPEMDRLALVVREKGIKTAFAPYEIQWRLMFATNEEVTVSCAGISPLSRYPAYDKEVFQAAAEGKPFAFILRSDFAFEEWAARGGMGFLTRDTFMRACREAGIDPRGEPVGEEFVIYWPLKRQFLDALSEAVQSAR